jgi:cytochrome c-type protein NapC
VIGTVEIIVVLIVLTIVLAAVFLARPSITAGATGKILAFVGLCVLPALCIGAGMSFHVQRSQQTAYCISCHSMESHGQSLYVLDTNYIPAQHFQNHLVPPDEACYTCHTDYTMYGPVKDKLKGLKYLYMEYVSTPPKTIHLDGTYNNLQCLHCHAGMRSFEENPTHTAIIGSLKTNQISCISCHNTIHNASEVAHLKMWVEGDAPTPVAAETAPAAAEPAAPAGPSKPPARSAAVEAAARGKGIFDSQGCGGCHGESGGGASGPALTRTSSRYSPAQLTEVLKAPTAQMKAAGMVPLTLDAADMTSLVSYVSSLGGTSAISSRGSVPASGSSSPALAKAPLSAIPGPPKAPAAAVPSASGVAPAGSSNAPTGSEVVVAAAGRGKSIFKSQGCGGCHGESGGGAGGPALTHTSSQYPPARLTEVLKAPTAQMKAAGMVPLTLNAADIEALVSYVDSLGGTSSASPAAPLAAGSPSPAPATGEPAVPAGPSKPPSGNAVTDAAAVRGKSIFKSQGCGGCHGESGGGASGPALTHTSSQYPPAQLTGVLKAPTAQMKAAGMVPLTLNAADMEALVSYVGSLGGTSSASPAASLAAGSSSTAPAVPSKSKPKGILRWLFLP